MTNVKLTEKIIIELQKLKYQSDYSTNSIDVINSKHMTIVQETILAVLNENINTDLAELKTKVKVYEEIIKKSNFKPFVSEVQE